MNTEKDDKNIDEIISRVINTSKPQFDAEKWKKKYPEEFGILQSRATQAPIHSFRWSSIMRKPFLKLAAAAVIIVVLCIFFGRDKVIPSEPIVKPVQESQSPTKIISMLSMRIAYQQGGFDALDQQFRETLDVMGPRSSKISMRELLEGTNGS